MQQCSRRWWGRRQVPYNKSLQRTFEPPPIFAAEKTGVASNAAELRRYITTHNAYPTHQDIKNA